MAGRICYIKSLSSVNVVIGRNVRLCSNSYAIQNTPKEDGLVTRKMTELLQWYEEITGMNEVRIAQNRVLEAEEKFVSAQERRREANKLVSEVQSKLKDLYAELDNTTRGEERYVQLVTQEHKILKDERRAAEEFHRCEREEREYFSVLSSVVKESHEKERAQAERTKYWSIIGSVIGTVIGVVGSSVNNELKMRELRRLVKESLARNELSALSAKVPEALSKHEKELSDILHEMKAIASLPSDQFLGRLDELVHTLDNKMNNEKNPTVSEIDYKVLNTVKQLEDNIDRQFNELKSVMYKRVEDGDDKIMVLPYGLEERLQHQQQTTQLVVTCCTVLTLTVPFLFRYFGLL